jgi:hypothetical protein
VRLATSAGINGIGTSLLDDSAHAGDTVNIRVSTTSDEPYKSQRHVSAADGCSLG